MICWYTASLVGPVQVRRPSYPALSRRRTESAIFPYACAVAPHELFPIIPPIVQLTCVDGFGPTISPCRAAASLTRSSTAPGSSTAVFASGSSDSILLQYLVQSMTTASLQHCPARLVPPPRDSTGAPNSRHTPIASTAASTLLGSTTPTGTCR